MVIDIKKITNRINKEINETDDLTSFEKEEVRRQLVDPYFYTFENEVEYKKGTFVDFLVVFQDHDDFKIASLIVYNPNRDQFGLGYRTEGNDPGCFIGYCDDFVEAVNAR